MGDWTIGGVRITRVEEMFGYGLPAATLLPAFDRERFLRHRDLLEPVFWDAASDRCTSSIHVWLVRLPGRGPILIDTATGNGRPLPHYPRFNMLDLPFLARLAGAGVRPEEVELVINTHLHVDHVGWNTHWSDGAWRPTFPNARYLMPEGDYVFWRDAYESANDSQKAVFDMSVKPIVDAGRTELLPDEAEIEGLFRFVPVPGHTPGMVAIEMRTGDRPVVFSADTFHHPVQVYEPGWSTTYCIDGALAARSRMAFMERYAGTDALVFPVHFGPPYVGTLERAGAAYAFRFARPERNAL